MALASHTLLSLETVGFFHRLELRQGSVMLWMHGISQRKGLGFLMCRTGSTNFRAVMTTAADDYE